MDTYTTPDSGVPPGAGAGGDVTLTPRLVVADAGRALEFYVHHLGATELERHVHQDRVVHAALDLDGYPLALKDGDSVDRDAEGIGGTPVLLGLEYPDTASVDAVIRAMVDAGARLVVTVQDRPDEGYGGRLVDPFGIVWTIGCRRAAA